jgi:hypothetical protein
LIDRKKVFGRPRFRFFEELVLLLATGELHDAHVHLSFGLPPEVSLEHGLGIEVLLSILIFQRVFPTLIVFLPFISIAQHVVRRGHLDELRLALFLRLLLLLALVGVELLRLLPVRAFQLGFGGVSAHAQQVVVLHVLGRLLTRTLRVLST